LILKLTILQEDLKTVLIKEDKLLLTNVTYSINMKLQKKFEIKKVYQHRGYYDQYSQFIFEKVYAEGCTVGIKRITQCLDEYGNTQFNSPFMINIIVVE
jgi:endothelial-specific receptor tyrosine kinase